MFARYQPRPLTFIGVEAVAGYSLKVYTIRHPDLAFDPERFAARRDLATATLPQPAVTEVRPGVGFAILHQAQGSDYLILGWWDRENELPTRVFLKTENESWRPAAGGESFCVWDLRVIWWEREAYVGTALAGSANALESYLAAVFEGDA